jgi:hypothetical protein
MKSNFQSSRKWGVWDKNLFAKKNRIIWKWFIGTRYKIETMKKKQEDI